MKLLGNKILVERIKSPTATTTGNILLPPIALDDHNTGGPKLFLVLQVGPGLENRKGIPLSMECEPGDRVLCQSYTQGAYELSDGRMIITHDMIIAVLPKQTVPQSP